MTKNALKGNKKIRAKSHNLEVSESQPRKKTTARDTKRYALKKVNKTKSIVSSKKTTTQRKNDTKKTFQQNNTVNQTGILKYLIVVTGTIFTFGSLGFGYTLRYAHKWQELMSDDSSLQNSFIQGKDVIRQEFIKELKIGN